MNAIRIVLAILSAGSIWAQTTIAVSGKITDASTGLPIEGASIALVQGGATPSRHMHLTDAGGTYSFDDVSPGSGSVEIGATGFLAFQKTNPDDFSIQIAADHAVHNFKLTPAASISGRIVGEGATPLGRNTVVTLFREDFSDGVRHFVAGTQGQVAAIEPDGSFSFKGLEPGRYIVSAGSPAGRSVAFFMNRNTGEVLPPEHPAEGYVQTYYPGTTEFSSALLISLAAGETRAADFKVAWRPLFRASGEVASGGESWQGTVQLSQTGDGVSQRLYSGSATVPGPFVVEGLPAGQYTATAITGVGQAIPNGTGFSMAMRMMSVNLSFAITDHDVSGFRIVSQPYQPLEVHGLFRTANGGSPLPTGLSVQYAYPAPGGESTPIAASNDGLFWLNGTSGDYSVQAIVPSGYAVTEVRYGGGNYLNSLIPLRGYTLDSSLTIVLSDQPGAITGTIVDAARIVLAPDPLPVNFDFRALRAVSVDSKGVFAFTGIAPGRYKAVALTGEDRKRDHDVAILEDKLRAADSFEVVAGQSVTIRVR